MVGLLQNHYVHLIELSCLEFSLQFVNILCMNTLKELIATEVQLYKPLLVWINENKTDFGGTDSGSVPILAGLNQFQAL